MFKQACSFCLQHGAESVNLIAGDKPADVYSGIAARWVSVCSLMHSILGRIYTVCVLHISSKCVVYWLVYGPFQFLSEVQNDVFPL